MSDSVRKVSSSRSALSVEQIARRRRSVPAMVYDPALPVAARREEIAEAIRNHQVVILCGETGSGKSTQLPKICLELGFGVQKWIGHTQPRRIAATSIAARLAQELRIGRQTPPSDAETEPLIPPENLVGCKIRFTDTTTADTCIKLMTDGILLAETRQDRALQRYEVLIIDEAHERSLNIDFLLGILRRLVDRRPELKVLITSATIDAKRFAAHFETSRRSVPILEVEGRTYPVEVIYAPIQNDEDDTDRGVAKTLRDGDVQQAVVEAIGTLSKESGDMLVFLPTERDIHEVVKLLHGEEQRRQMALFRNERVEILPLFARLPADQQQRIFTPGGRRRIVLATNVAESSVTVPGIRFVIDTGTARISRYSARSKTQRLPIEPISQASADQRKGRCGRVGSGVCMRLYSEEDYRNRDRYTQPEIQRTHLASVILQTKTLNLGRIEAFPFLDPPRQAAIHDGYKTLFELQALTAPNATGAVTPLGETLSRLPVDPRIGRMILAAVEEVASANVLREILVLAAALEIRDPRERPVEKQGEADSAHQKFLDGRSDFVGLLKLWDFYNHLKETLSRSALLRACRQNYLSWNRMREWQDVYFQLLELVSGILREARLPLSLLRAENRPLIPPTGELSEAKYIALHRSLLRGFLANIGAKSPSSPEYLVGGGGKSFLWPGSGMVRLGGGNSGTSPTKEKTQDKPRVTRAQWVMAAEMVETSKRFLRTLAAIEPEWVEELAAHLVNRSYSEPHWSKQNNSVMVYEKVSLFGLTVVPRRRVAFGKVDPVAARQLFIQLGLVEGNWESNAPFYVQNQTLMERLEQVQAKLRQFDFLPGSERLFAFYDERIPLEVCDRATMEKWLRDLQSGLARGPEGRSGRETLEYLQLKESDLLDTTVDPTLPERFPDTLAGDRRFPLEYRFTPGDISDGVVLHTTLETLHQLSPQKLLWGIPGTLEERVAALIKSLPKETRRKLIPAPDTARTVCQTLVFGEGDLLEVIARALTRIAGERLTPESFDLAKVPDSLRLNIQVSDAEGKTLAEGRDFHAILRQVGSRAEEKFAAVEDSRWTKSGLTAWNFGELPEKTAVAAAHFGRTRSGETVTAYPMLVDEGTHVAMRLASSPFQAEASTRQAILRLFRIYAQREWTQQAVWMPGFAEMQAQAEPFCRSTQTPFVDVVGDLLTRAVFDPAGFPKLEDMPPLLTRIPRTQKDFEALCKTARGRISVVVQDVAAPLRTLWKAYHAAHKSLNTLCRGAAAPAPLTLGKVQGTVTRRPSTSGKTAFPQATHPLFQPILDDISQQLERLFYPGFLLTTPWIRVRHFPRYLQAISARVETLRTSNSGGKLAQTQASVQIPELEAYWKQYAERAENYRLRCLDEPRLDDFRWMLEEYRVSLFAQKLGTASSVSAKRLTKWLETLE